MKNLLYSSELGEWDNLSLIEQLELSGQSQSVYQRRQRIGDALKAAIAEVTKCNQ